MSGDVFRWRWGIGIRILLLDCNAACVGEGNPVAELVYR
jgi:hypothetical protein